jgi:phosphotransferase system IIB component
MSNNALPLANCNPCTNCPPVPALLTPCVDSEPCEELGIAGCVKYGGDDIVEGNILNGERLDETIQKLLVGMVSGVACISPVLKCITKLRSTVVTANTITLAWNKPTDNVSMTLQYKTDSAQSYTDVVVDGLTTKQLTGLTANTKYLIKIASVASGNTACSSVTIAVTTKTA